MSVRGIRRTLFAIGALCALLALAWWWLMYSAVAAQAGMSPAAFAECLLAPSALCNTYRGMAWLRGMPPYEPGVLWLAIGQLACAAALGGAARREAGASGARPEAGRSGGER